MQQAETDNLLKRITYDKGISGAKPIIRGLHFRVTDVLEMLANNMTKEQILEEHPILEAEDITAVLLYASMILGNITLLILHDSIILMIIPLRTHNLYMKQPL